MTRLGESREVLTPEPVQGVRCQMSRKWVVGISLLCTAAVLGTVMVVYLVPSTQVATPSEPISEPKNAAPVEDNSNADVIKKISSVINQEHPRELPAYNSKTPRSERASDLRLPTSVRPSNYNLRLRPFINGNFTIFGFAEITLEVSEDTDNVTLHISDIITQNETVTIKSTADLTGPGLSITSHTYDQSRNFYIVQLGEPMLAGGQYLLSMEWEGYLNDQLAGFYRSSYTNANNETVFLAVTQMEPVDARKAFPCFDEPEMKATFNVSIARESSMTSIANMPLASTIPHPTDADWFWDNYEPSVPMSTYLVAFVVSDFTFVNSTYNDHVLFRIWARSEAIDTAEYANQAGPAILTFYEEYFGIPFPLPKQDMIAIPDFSAGAMENWGLITYRETALLYDPVLGSASNKERVAYVIAHELAHQWFGDLVTMKWWNDLWLNEGFASFTEYIGTDFYEPTWGIIDRFVTRDLQPIFGSDGLESSHPISVEVEDPDEINQLFDGISYSKGASIIRMMYYFLTESTFRTGITNYLNENAYGNAEQDDLWAALTAQAELDGTLPVGLTVKTVMDTWTLQMGYPVINVVLNGDGTASLTQERFLLYPNPNSTDTNVYRWWVPISWTSQDSPDFSLTYPKDWMDASTDTATISGMPAAGNWVILNVQQTNYYRVNYEESNWQLIIQQLATDYSVVHPSNRAQLLDDSIDLARAGRVSYDIAFAVFNYLSNELDYTPWSAALSGMNYIEEMFTRTSGYGALKNYLTTLLTPYYTSVGFDDSLTDPHLEQLSRTQASSWMCKLGYADCVDNSVSLFAQYMATPSDETLISPNLKSTVYCTALAEGGETEWDFLWGKYQTSDLAAEQDRILSSLACTKEIWLLERYLEMAFTEGSGIRKQDSNRVFSYIANNDIGRDLAWDYLRLNVNEIALYYNSFGVIGGLVQSASSEFNTQTELDELIQFKAENEGALGTATQAVDQSIEQTQINIEWMASYYDVINTWLIDNGYGTGLRMPRRSRSAH